MFFASIFAVGIFLASASGSSTLYGRDIDGSLKRLSWEKRSNPGDVLKLPLVNNDDQSYSVPVRMGTPFQEVQMAVSLSQNYIIVASPDTSTGNAGFYNPSQSSSFTQSSASTVVRGNNGQSVTANFAGESCQVSDFNYDASVAITPASANINYDIYPKGCHGVLGYGVDGPPDPKNSSLLGVYLPQNITTAVCGIELNWNGDTNQGVFTMGGTDASAYTGGFTKMIVPPATSVERPSWSIPVDSIHAAVDNGVQSISGNIASIDPYYPNIELPADAVQTLYSKISNAVVSPSNSNRYTVPCNTKIQLTMIFGGRNFTMDPRDAIRNENGTCYGVVQATSSGNLYKIGSPFMRNVYTTFGLDVKPAGTELNVAFATKVLRAGARANSGTTTNKPSLSAALVVLACIYMIAA